jgi:hypothetical protein
VLALTRAGRKLVPVLAQLADDNDEEAFGHLEKRDRDTLLSLMKALAEHHGLKGAPVE